MPNPQETPVLPLKAIAGLALQLGFAVATAAFLFAYGGNYLAEKYAAPYLFWLGVILGLLTSLYLVWQIVRALLNRQN